MTRRVSRIRKWGGSMGLVVARDVVTELALRPGDEVEYEIKRPRARLQDITGILAGQLKDIDWDWVMKEIASGWDD